MKTDLKRYMCPNVPSNIIYHSQDTEATSVPINRSMGEDVANTHTHTHTHVLDYYSAILPLAFATMWMELV